MELVNHGPEPIIFKAGDPIVQIVFSRLDMPTDRPYDGKYQHQTKGAHPARYEAGSDEVHPAAGQGDTR